MAVIPDKPERTRNTIETVLLALEHFNLKNEMTMTAFSSLSIFIY